jgi:hypothetical protein
MFTDYRNKMHELALLPVAFEDCVLEFEDRLETHQPRQVADRVVEEIRPAIAEKRLYHLDDTAF